MKGLRERERERQRETERDREGRERERKWVSFGTGFFGTFGCYYFLICEKEKNQNSF